MFNFFNKNNKKNEPLTIYSNNLRALVEALLYFSCPFIVFLLPWIGLYIKLIIFTVLIFPSFQIIFEVWRQNMLTKIPLFTISAEGIKPILTRRMEVHFNAPVIPWTNIAQVCLYKAPIAYAWHHHELAGFIFVGIKLIDKDQQTTVQPTIIQTVQSMIPYTNNIDIPLTVAHPYTSTLIKELNRYHKQYLEQVLKIGS